jgi:tRNA G18 (ribose-2'-O)-methylase SpoU
MLELVIIAHNLRSTHNVGSLLRTAEGLSVDRVFLTGYTPYPTTRDDKRLPHIHHKLTRDIHKTALGAEASGIWQHQEDIATLIARLKSDGYTIAALEQTPTAVALPDYQPPSKLAVILGREVEGVEPEVLVQTDLQLVIPMFGTKESFNVVQAAAMAMYHCVFYGKRLGK